MMLSKINLPPLLIRQHEFNDSGCFWEHENQEDSALQIATLQFYPQWTPVISQSCENVNSFCPYCGAFVRDFQKLETLIQGVDAACRAHVKCVQKKQNSQTQLKFRKSIYTLQKGYLEISPSNSQLGGKEFVVSTSICHPLSSYKYFQMDRKTAMQDGNVLLNLDSSIESWNSFTVNRILLPIPEMNFKVGLKQIGSEGEQQNIDFNVDLSQIFVGLQMTEKHSAWVITFSNLSGWTANVEVELIFDETEKRKQIDMMNFKFPHPIISTLPLIKVNKIVLTPKTHDDKAIKLGISNTKASSNFDELCEQVEEQSMVLSSSVAVPQIIQPKGNPELIKVAKTQAGSKEIQRNLRNMKSQELDFLIDEILPYMVELLEDDYANYMIQTLVSYSNSEQRLKIFKALNKAIINLVCLKQGTFAFQQMCLHIHTEEEFSFFAQMMAQHFLQVSTNPNGNHFLRKIIPMMPFRFNQMIIHAVFPNFLDLVNDKNAVCVLKVILRILSNERQNPMAKEMIFQLIKELSANVDQIIKNEFGNYFIQEAFEILGEKYLREISEFIFTKLRGLAKEKFSSSVICRCLRSYWKDTDCLNRLKSKLNTAQIVELFKNKEGNKVLLELMFSQADESFKNRIMKAIEKFMPSKFNSSKWVGVGVGSIKRGAGNNMSLSDGMKDTQKKAYFEKKGTYIIH